jgi:hypothetical protein
MKKINVNYVSKKIELSESFAKKAGTVGSTEYQILVSVQKEYPKYNVEVIKSKKTIKGIDYNFMRDYITNHDESSKLLSNLDKLVAKGVSYLEIKAWFMEQYPAFKNYKTRTEWILAA